MLSIIDVNGVVWFKGNDICDVLGYSDHKQALQYNISKTDRTNVKSLKSCGVNFTPHKIPYQMVFVNESGINSLILQSTKPAAKKFKKWITSKVLPQIRKHGFYTHEEHIPSAKAHDDGYVYFSHKSMVNDINIENFLVQPTVFNERTDLQDKHSIMNTMKRNKQIDFFENESITTMYLYMTSIKNVNDNRMICKVGFATDIVRRHLQLVDSVYKAHFHIIGI